MEDVDFEAGLHQQFTSARRLGSQCEIQHAFYLKQNPEVWNVEF
jgi:hypothetical protein